MLHWVLIVHLCPVLWAINVNDYPPPNQIPPVNQAWTKAFEALNLGPGGVITQCPRSNQWANTYDDGPSASTTDTALAALATRKLKGTFFVIGSNALQNPNVLLKAFQQGHQIAIHTWSHPDLTKLTNDQIVSEIVWTARLIRDITGVTPTMMRPPLGSFDNRVLRLIASMGLKTVTWNRDTNDWRFSFYQPGQKVEPPFQPNDTPDAIHREFEKWVQEPMQGSISLQHDIYVEPTKQIGPSLDVLLKSSYQITTVVGCLGGSAYDDQLLSRIGLVSDVVPPVILPTNSPNVPVSSTIPPVRPITQILPTTTQPPKKTTAELTNDAITQSASQPIVTPESPTVSVQDGAKATPRKNPTKTSSAASTWIGTALTIALVSLLRFL